MPISTFNIEWLNQNATRRYPLTSESTCKDETGAFTIPSDFIVSLNLPVHAAMGVSPDRFFIRQLGAYPQGYSIVVSYVETDDVFVDVATSLIPARQQTRNTAYALAGIEPYEDTVGSVVIGQMTTISSQPTGLWSFKPDATWLEMDVIRPIVRGVQALILVNAGQRSIPITGDVEFVAGTNMRITPSFVAGMPTRIQFDAISGEGLMETCVCEGDIKAAPPIRRINGIPGDVDGNFYLIGDHCLSVQGITNGLQISDECSKPCCSCEELEKITRDLERFDAQRLNLMQFQADLSNQVGNMQSLVLSSRIGDRGCGG